jgi:hypothetical protein
MHHWRLPAQRPKRRSPHSQRQTGCAPCGLMLITAKMPLPNPAKNSILETLRNRVSGPLQVASLCRSSPARLRRSVTSVATDTRVLPIRRAFPSQAAWPAGSLEPSPAFSQAAQCIDRASAMPRIESAVQSSEQLFAILILRMNHNDFQRAQIAQDRRTVNEARFAAWSACLTLRALNTSSRSGGVLPRPSRQRSAPNRRPYFANGAARHPGGGARTALGESTSALARKKIGSGL